MSDKTDKLIEEYISGILDIKIKYREKELSLEGNNLSEDTILQMLKMRKDFFDDLMIMIKGQSIERIIIARFTYHLTWLEVGERLCLEESTARKKYYQFKKIVNEIFLKNIKQENFNFREISNR